MTRSSDDLYEALRKGDLKTFVTLLQTHGWPSNSEWSDYHLFSEAIKFGRQSVANYLLDQGCRVIKPGSSITFVHVALTYSDWADVVEKLLDRGAPVSTVDARGDTAVHVAFKSKRADARLIDLLLAIYAIESSVNAKDREGLSILHIACSTNNLNIVQALMPRDTCVAVSRDAVNAQVQSSYDTGYSRYTPLHFAVKNGCTEIVKYLLRHFHLDIYKVDANASTPLHLALERSDIAIMDCLLAYDKVHVDNVNNMGFTHFMAACAGSDTSIAAEYLRLTQYRPWTSSVDSLVNNRVAEFGGSPYRGYSALHFAAEFGRLDTVQLLLDRGASCFALSAESLTPLVVALKRGHEYVTRLLWAKYKAYRQTIYDAADGDDRKRSPSSNEQNKESTGVKSQRPSPPSGSNQRNKSPTTSRRGLVEKKIGSKPPGFSSPPRQGFAKPPGFPSRC